MMMLSFVSGKDGTRRYIRGRNRGHVLQPPNTPTKISATLQHASTDDEKQSDAGKLEVKFCVTLKEPTKEQKEGSIDLDKIDFIRIAVIGCKDEQTRDKVLASACPEYEVGATTLIFEDFKDGIATDGTPQSITMAIKAEMLKGRVILVTAVAYSKGGLSSKHAKTAVLLSKEKISE